MSVHPVSATEAMARLGEYSQIIDARSEGEFAEDRLPGAVNWPSLNNEERIRVGTLYKQQGAFEAQKIGAALVARNVSRHIERDVLDKTKAWQPLIYCWRGGKRSNSLALILGQIGFRVHLLEGGYKAFRTALRADLPVQARRLTYRVICGPTGSGKTRLLQALQAAGAQVLDLEALASHRSSVLGVIPGQPQPTQKAFDTRVWDTLRGFDASRPVFVEAESKKVGNLAIPDALIEAMRASPCALLQLSDDERVELLLEDYAFFATDTDFFCRRLEALTALRGRAVVEGWVAQVRSGQIRAVVRELLLHHYDPGYATSTRRNFVQFDAALPLLARDRSMAAMSELAATLVHEPAP